MSTAPPSFLTDSIVDPDESVVDSLVVNDGFYPDISLKDLRSKYQVSDDYSAQRRLQCLTEGVRQVNSDIEAKKLYWLSLGYSKLELVPEHPADEMKCSNSLCFVSHGIPCQQGHLTMTNCPSFVAEAIYQPRIDAYLDAVYCFALKLMAERYRSTKTDQAATAKVTQYEGQVDYWNGEYIRHTRFVNDDIGATIEASTI